MSEAKRALLEQRMRGIGPAYRVPAVPPVSRRGAIGPAPLSVAQEQLWYFSQLAPDNPVYNEAASIRKDGPLDLVSLRWAFNEIVRRHEIWRTVFVVEDGRPLQVVRPPRAFELPLTDLSRIPADQRELAAASLVAEESRRPYRLSEGPLVRPLLVRFTEDHHRLYLGMHHLIFDGVSLYRIVLRELIALYQARVSGLSSPLEEPVLQYADFARWELDWGGSDEMRRRLEYWRRRLDNVPSLELPLDRPRPARQQFRGGMEALTISSGLTAELRSIAQNSGCTLFQVVSAAFAVLLHRYTGQEDVVYGTMADLRQRPELESMVGYCLTPLVLRLDVSGDPTFAELLSRSRDEVLTALSNLAPFEQVVREVQPKRDPSLNPIYQAMVVMEPPVAAADPSWSLHQMDVAIGNAVGHAKLDLHVELDERPEGHMSGRLIYNSDVFDRATASRMGGHLVHLLEGIAGRPTTRLSQLPLMTDEELHRQVVEWNATEASYPYTTTLHQLVEAQAKRTPQAIAVECAGHSLTYGELDRRANRLARSLQASGVAARDLVAICLPRSLDMLVGMLGILKAGAAYVPLDPSYPAERLAFMVQDSGARVVVTTGDIPKAVSALDVTVLHVPAADGESDATDTPPIDGATADDLAYVIYTSGSTGRPKGVCIPHRAVVNLVCSMAREPGLGASDKVLAITTYSFDIAVVELWLPLVRGARIELAPTEVAADGHLLGRLFVESRPTFMQATPATWRMLVESGWTGDPGLVALAGGEAVDRRLADELLDRCGTLWNVYGPTETTVWSTLGPIERGEGVTIGRPIANTSVYVLDRHQGPQPVGVPGEMFIAGHGLARGYLNRPELTTERFVPNPFRPGTTMYATGDRGRLQADGRIEHLGRLDNQVKVRGYRIETGEVEAALMDDARVASAVVVAREDRFGERRLVAYIVEAQGRSLDIAGLRSAMKRTLPDFMIPSEFVSLAALPLTPNGKVDRKALPAPDAAARGHTGAYVAPATPLEEQLATIWAGVLGIDRVGTHDDFFDLGGHSMLAVRLLAEIHRVVGVEVPVAAFFHGASTIAGLAKALGDADPQPTSALLFNVQPKGSRPALFFVHSHETTMLTLRHFLGPLGPDQPVIALLPEREDHRFARSGSVERIAQILAAAVRRAQAHGPYYIAGHSFGGILAYEIAGQLRKAGEDVGWVGVLDAGTPAEARRWLNSQLSPLARLKRLRQLGLRRAPAKVLEVVLRESNEAMVGIGKKLDPLGESQYDWEGAMALVVKYQPKGIDAPLDLFIPTEQLIRSTRRYLGWEEIHSGPVAVFEVPGDHLSMLSEPQVDALARLVADRLHAAQEPRPVPAG